VTQSEIIAELMMALKMALRHAREAMPADERADFDQNGVGPEWMATARDTVAKVERFL
jgi:hypothetical protein